MNAFYATRPTMINQRDGRSNEMAHIIGVVTYAAEARRPATSSQVPTILALEAKVTVHSIMPSSRYFSPVQQAR